jgi:rSAM/selenodomain-associated transferase 1
MGFPKVLTVMAKAHLPGEVKTRLASILSPQGAAELSLCFFLDAMELAESVSDCEVVLAYSPDDALDAFPVAGTLVAECIPQGEGDLGVRMHHVFESLFGKGYSKVVLIGSDMPTLPLRYLQEAFSLLEVLPVVLGPSMDGGYYLIGMQTTIPEIFAGIDWGTSQVLSQTIERLTEKDIQSMCLPTWYDVDNPEDLNFLIAHLDLLQGCTDERLPRHTVGFLKREGLLFRRSIEAQVDDG